MLDSVIGYLKRLGEGDESAAAFDEEEVAAAIAALLKQMALADGELKQVEAAEASRIFSESYGHLEEGGPGKGAMAEEFENARHETVFPLAVIINKSLSSRQRQDLKGQLMKIAMSDSEFHPDEQDLMALLDNLIED
jgi:uncharacterized tellurite resistance protein B-like protein